MTSTMPKKACSRCKNTLLISLFSRDARQGDGLQRYCKRCSRAYQRKHYRQRAKPIKKQLSTVRKRQSQGTLSTVGDEHPVEKLLAWHKEQLNLVSYALAASRKGESRLAKMYWSRSFKAKKQVDFWKTEVAARMIFKQQSGEVGIEVPDSLIERSAQI